MDSYDRQNTLQHERLDAYAVAVELDGAVVAIAHRSGRGRAWIADQAMRASASVVLNLAEALGREGADRARALRIAREGFRPPRACEWEHAAVQRVLGGRPSSWTQR